MKKGIWISALIIVAVIVIAYFILIRNSNGVSEELAKCIGENSELYVQLGCHACRNQEKMFGINYRFLNVTDCWFESEKCVEKKIEATPTWITAGQQIRGVQSIETLKQLTGC